MRAYRAFVFASPPFHLEYIDALMSLVIHLFRRFDSRVKGTKEVHRTMGGADSALQLSSGGARGARALGATCDFVPVPVIAGTDHRDLCADENEHGDGAADALETDSPWASDAAAFLDEMLGDPREISDAASNQCWRCSRKGSKILSSVAVF